MIAQGSPEWLALRCGKVTASRVADIMRKTKTGVSATRQRYLGELVAERLTGVPHQGFKSADMEWGNATEESARNHYAFITDASLTEIAFVPHPTIAMCGASPDRLVGDDGLLEIKAPATHTHIETLLSGAVEPDYQKQMCLQMACTGRQWTDFVSYDPRMPEDLRMFVKRFERDETAIKEMESEIEKFNAEVEETIARLCRAYGLNEKQISKDAGGYPSSPQLEEASSPLASPPASSSFSDSAGPLPTQRAARSPAEEGAPVRMETSTALGGAGAPSVFHKEQA